MIDYYDMYNNDTFLSFDHSIYIIVYFKIKNNLFVGTPNNIKIEIVLIIFYKLIYS